MGHMLTALILALALFQEPVPGVQPGPPIGERQWPPGRVDLPRDPIKREQAEMQEDERELRRKVRRFMQTFGQWAQLHAQNSRAATVDAKDFKREQELFVQSRKLFDDIAKQPALKRYSDKKR